MMIAKGQVVAIGGGGFAANPPNLAIDRYLLGLARRQRPRAGPLRPLDCLGFLAGSCCPHYDGAAAHFVDGKLARVLSWRKGAAAHRVTVRGGAARERRLAAKRLAAFAPDWPLG